jgi:glycosyltransferase involved in cell wall biosynthesis
VACAANHYGPTKGPLAVAGVMSRETKMRRQVDLFLPVSSIVQRFSRLLDEESQVMPNFISELPPPPAADDRLAQLPDEPFVLYFGDITLDKGVWNLAEAYRGLPDAPPLVLIGRSYLGELGNQPDIRVFGPWPHELVIEALRRSLFTVAPSIWPEPFGLVALEAAAAGKPVIASDIGGLIDIVVDGETGILVPPGDRMALSQAMLKLIDDASLRERMGAAGIDRASHFSSAALVPRVEAAYERALGLRRSKNQADR